MIQALFKNNALQDQRQRFVKCVEVSDETGLQNTPWQWYGLPAWLACMAHHCIHYILDHFLSMIITENLNLMSSGLCLES